MLKNKFEFISFIVDRFYQRESDRALSSLINKISIFCLIICSAVCIVIGSISNGFQEEILDRLSCLFGDINISYQNNWKNNHEFEVWLKNQCKENFSVNKFVSSLVLIEKNEEKIWSILHSCGIDTLNKVISPENACEINPDSVILSKDLASNTQNKPGDYINISSLGLVNLHTKGKVYSIMENCLGFNGQQFLIAPSFLAEKIITKAGLSIVSFSFSAKDKSRINETYLKMIDELPPHFKIIKMDDYVPETLSWINLISNYASTLISILIFLLNSLLISITTVSIFNKHFSIRIFKILGLTRVDILLIYIFYMFKRFVTYIFLGNIFAFTILFLQKKIKIISLSPDIYLVSSIPVSFDWNLISKINVSMVGTLFISFCLTVLVTEKKLKVYDFLH